MAQEAERAIVNSLLPLTLRSPPPTDQSISDDYINTPDLRQDPVIDALMPLYLSEELSPRFAKHKVSKTWEYRKAVEASLRNQIGEDRVREFEDGGRDEGLRDVMDSDEAGLEGVPLRPRTVKEVREAALAEHDEEVTEERMRVKEFLVRGWNWDRERNQWIRGGKALRTQRKKLKKVEKAKRLEVRMRDLQLKPGKNVVVPKGLGLEESRMVEAG